MKYKLTHFTRFIPATAIQTSLAMWLRLSLWSSMVLLLVLNIAIRFNNPSLTQITHSVLDRLILVQSFLGYGHVSLANAKLNNLNENTKANVLGETISESSPLSSWQKESEKLNNQLAYWEGVASSHPEYRDAYLAIARIAFALNKPEMVSDNLRKAEMLDPNGASIKIFENLTK